MIIGMDFGTTNSGMATYDGRRVSLLPLDPANTNPHVLRTALYIQNDQTVLIGRAAVDAFFKQNVGRSAQMQRVWVGEIEVVADRVHYVTDVYVYIDALSPGRLFLSFKTSLRDRSYQGTVIGQFFYPVEDLVATYLNVARRRAERLLEQPLTDVVLGRPVRFATNPADDRLAQERLLRAAFRAGYERVYLQREPVAAAYNYAATQTAPQNILVFDFGGGTLDLTVMRSEAAARRVLATGGLPVAGDVFDQRLVRAKLPPHFGEGSSYGPPETPLPIPHWIYDRFADWQRILELQTPANKRVLTEIAQTARKPRQIEALISLVSGNYGLQMFDAVERGKRELSERLGTMIRLKGTGFKVMELVTRSEFEAVIRAEINAIDAHIDEVVGASGLTHGDIDAVVRTGGSAEIPVFQTMLQAKFGADRLQSVDTFSSVSAGLGIYAHQIESGAVDAAVYTPEDIDESPPAADTNVPFVNLDIIRRRVAVAERPSDIAPDERPLLIVVDDAGAVTCAPRDDAGPPEIAVRQALIAAPETPLVLVTSRYRFMALTARQLHELPENGLTLESLFTLGTGEHVCALADWGTLKRRPGLLLVTSRGFVRAYQTEALAPRIDGPVPFMFDQPLLGRPVALLGVDGDEAAVLVTGAGRGARFALADLPIAGRQALKCDEGDWVVDAAVVAESAPLLLATASGHGRRLRPHTVPAPPRPNQRGRALIARRPVVALRAAGDGRPLTALTNHALRPVEPEALPLDETPAIRSHRLLRLQKGERVLALAGEAG